MQYPCFLTKIGQLLPGIAMMLSRRSSNNRLRQPYWIGIALGLVVGAWLPLSSIGQKGYAQNFTDEEVSNYAAAVLAMENMRQRAYAEISDIMVSRGLDVTRYDLRCLSASTLDLPRVVRRPVRILLINYCNDAKEIVEDTGLTVQLFNSITVTHRQDEELAEQIQSEIAEQSR